MAWPKRFLNLFRSNRLSRDLDREMSFHMAERTDDLVSGGMRGDEARREAYRRFGNRTLQMEQAREADVLTWLETLVADLRYAARGLRGSPGFTLVAVLSLALGIGANAGIFTLFDAAILKVLPVRHPEELAQVVFSDSSAGQEFTYPIWEQVREHPAGFSSLFAFADEQFNLTSGGEAHRVYGNWVSGDYFTGLGVRAAAGRLLARSDDLPGCSMVAVVSNGFAEQEFGGAAAAVGKRLSLDAHSFDVIGVVDADFFGLEVGRLVQIYAPFCAMPGYMDRPTILEARSRWFLQIMGRLAAGVTVPQATSRLQSAAPAIFAATLPTNWSAKDLQDYLKQSFALKPSAGGAFSSLRKVYGKALVVLMGVVGLVLLIACVNVANLLLARAAVRQREIAIRMSVGAGRSRVIRQLLTESLLLSAISAALGVFVAVFGSRLLVHMLASGTRTASLDLSVDWRIVAFTVAVATATGVLFGLAPAWKSTRVDLQSVMKATSRSTIEGHSRFTFGKALVVVQVAMSLVLVIGASLLLGTFQRLVRLDPGFRSDGLLLAAVDLSSQHLSEPQQRVMHRTLVDRARSLPGVRSASASLITPLGNAAWNEDIAVDGFTPKNPRDDIAWFNGVSDGYFTTMGSRLVSGRDIAPSDRESSPRVAVINESLARHFFGSANPLGKVFRVRSGDTLSTPVEIIGVVQDAKYQSMRETPRPTAFEPLSQAELFGSGVNVEVRTDGDPTAVIPSLKASVAQISPAISLTFTSMRAQVAAGLTRERLMATLSGFFGGLALLLAVVGLYGMMSYSVERRRNEIGVRIALGCERPMVLRLVMGETGRLLAGGIVIGLAGALAGGKLVASFLYGATPRDPGALAAAVAALSVAAMAAGFLPAWRASRLDPVAALRDD